MYFFVSFGVGVHGVSNQDFFLIIIYFFSRAAIKSSAPLIEGGREGGREALIGKL